MTLQDLPEKESDRISISTFRQAASQHANEIIETIQLEREEHARQRAEEAAERERLADQLADEHKNLLAIRDDRIRALEEELQKVKDELVSEREARLTEEAAAREQDREERMERDMAFEKQLGDITNLVQEQRDHTERKTELMEQRWAEKQERRQGKEFQMIELREIVMQLHNDLAIDRQRAEEARDMCATKEDLRAVIEQLQRQNDEQRQLLEMFSESWRADCARHQEETIAAVRATAETQVPFNVENYLKDFSQALATEVRLLLGEVGKLREDRRALQHEIATLLFMKTKWGPGGEFDPEWRPPQETGSGPPPPPPPPPEDAPQDAPAHARPGWRPTGKKGKKKKAAQQAPPQPQPAMEQFTQSAMSYTAYGGGQPLPRRQPNVLSPRTQVESWQPEQWHPDPNYEPSSIAPSTAQPTVHVAPPPPAGLFGPGSDQDSRY